MTEVGRSWRPCRGAGEALAETEGFSETLSPSLRSGTFPSGDSKDYRVMLR